MSNNASPTKKKARADATQRIRIMHANGYCEYRAELNPHEPGSLRYERFERHWRCDTERWHKCEAWWDGMFDVLGGRPEKKVLDQIT